MTIKKLGVITVTIGRDSDDRNFSLYGIPPQEEEKPSLGIFIEEEKEDDHYAKVNEACEKNEIVIINDLGPGRILQYHCRYPKKDFGVQYLNFDAIKTIQLRDEGFNITKWHCLLKHGQNMRYHKDILVYSQNTRAPQCGQVRVWTARL
ncbi:predicted protein, partial [Arabidopsis lyrata subsp. lyrata]